MNEMTRMTEDQLKENIWYKVEKLNHFANRVYWRNGKPYWKDNYNSIARKDKLVGHKNPQNYRVIGSASLNIKAHHLRWYMEYHRLPSLEIDHIDRNPDNNRIENLREATRSQNTLNIPPKKGSTSKYKGVSKNPKDGLFYARSRVDGKDKHIGCFNDEIQAALAYDSFVYSLHGNYAYLNFPDLIKEAQND